MMISRRGTRSNVLFCLLLITVLMLTTIDVIAEDVEGMIIGGKLHLREGASLDSRILATYESNTTLEIISEENGFYQVIMPDGKTGYMEAKYIYAAAGDDIDAAAEAGQVIGGELH